jgi:hypothetical protein
MLRGARAAPSIADIRGIVMHRSAWLRRALSVVYEEMGSAGCTELAQITIFSLSGMVFSMLVIAPGHRTLAAIYTLCARLIACN